MQYENKPSIGITLAALVGFFSPFVTHACSIIYSPIQVGSEFRVRVMDHGWPVQSLRLVLSPNDSTSSGRNEAIYSLTDEAGYARFANLNPGVFVLTVDKDGGMGETAVVEVKMRGATNKTVSLNWPRTTALRVRSVSGILRGPDYYPQQTQAQLSLSLLETVSTSVIETTQTDSKGRFSFVKAVPSGIYLLRLNPSDLRGWDGSQIEGMIPIAVDPKAAQHKLDVVLGWSSCGLGYAQRVNYPEIKIGKLCGAVADPLGAAIAKAQVVLMADGENVEIIEQSRTEENGKFDLREQTEGTYQLLIKSPGFQPFLEVVHLDNSRAPQGCRRPIRVRLDLVL